VIDVIGSGGWASSIAPMMLRSIELVAIKMLKERMLAAGKVTSWKQFSPRATRNGKPQHRTSSLCTRAESRNGKPLLVMECLDGEPVSRVINERRPMPIVDKLELFVQVCDGLQHAHDRKPQVIHQRYQTGKCHPAAGWNGEDRRLRHCRVVGIETSTLQRAASGQLILPVARANQFRPIDARTDIFSAGVMLYELADVCAAVQGNEPARCSSNTARRSTTPLDLSGESSPRAAGMRQQSASPKRLTIAIKLRRNSALTGCRSKRKIKQGMAADFMQPSGSLDAARRPGTIESPLQEILALTAITTRRTACWGSAEGNPGTAALSANRAMRFPRPRLALAGQSNEERWPAPIKHCTGSGRPSFRGAARRNYKGYLAGQGGPRLARRAESALYAGDFDEAREAVTRLFVWIPIAPKHAPWRRYR